MKSIITTVNGNLNMIIGALSSFGTDEENYPQYRGYKLLAVENTDNPDPIIVCVRVTHWSGWKNNTPKFIQTDDEGKDEYEYGEAGEQWSERVLASKLGGVSKILEHILNRYDLTNALTN